MFPVVNRIRELLLDSEKDIEVLVNTNFFKIIENEFSGEELAYALKYLDGKGYFKKQPGGIGYAITTKGYEEWLFPDGEQKAKKVFISYSVKDRGLAGQLKDGLKASGIDAFLAHEDIEPSEKWRDRIISDLKSSATFIALRTENYLRSPYTEQECGFALALNKRILTLSIDTSTEEMGFCSEFQGEKFKSDEIEKIISFCIKQLN